jgi:hypothetical protein
MMRLTMMLALALGASGCGDDTTAGLGMDMAVGIDMAASPFPAAPTIGTTMLDRMGRPAINTALTDPFFIDKTMHEAKLDAYNRAPPSMWPSFAPQFAAALAVFDGLDGICGNQPLFNSAGADGGASGGYGTLAAILANDQLLLDTTVTSCDPTKNSLAVEIGVITNSAPASCGGRTPLDPTINVTYAALSGGIISGIVVTDGVSGDGDATGTAQGTTFPFLGDPQP